MVNPTPNPGEYTVKRPIEIKCTECGLVSVPKFQMEKNRHDNFIYSDGCLTLCDSCMSKGWTDDPKEIMEAFEKDPGFKLGVKSPYQHKKY